MLKRKAQYNAFSQYINADKKSYFAKLVRKVGRLTKVVTLSIRAKGEGYQLHTFRRMSTSKKFHIQLFLIDAQKIFVLRACKDCGEK